MNLMKSAVVRNICPRMLGAALLVLAFHAASLQAQQGSQAPAPTAEQKGKQHFVTYLCYSCHGYGGHGGQADLAPRIDPNRISYEVFSRYVRKPGGSMMPYATEKQIPEAALQEIYAYLKSVPPPPDPKSIPLLND